MALVGLSSVNVANQTLIKQFVNAPITKPTRTFRTIAICSSGRQIALSAPAHAPLLVGAIFLKRGLRNCALERRRCGRLFSGAHLPAPASPQSGKRAFCLALRAPRLKRNLAQRHPVGGKLQPLRSVTHIGYRVCLSSACFRALPTQFAICHRHSLHVVLLAQSARRTGVCVEISRPAVDNTHRNPNHSGRRREPWRDSLNAREGRCWRCQHAPSYAPFLCAVRWVDEIRKNTGTLR